jgi:hypothetical protein
MSDLRKAAEMALETLEETCGYLPVKSGVGREVDDAMTTLRQALAQPEQKRFIVDRGCREHGCMAYDWRDGDGVNISSERVDETAKCKQEPVAWLSKCFNEDGDPLGYTAHEQEVYGSFPVYTAPPKHEWVGLTDEEGAEIWGDAHDIDWKRLVTPKEIIKRTEAKLKEKNT